MGQTPVWSCLWRVGQIGDATRLFQTLLSGLEGAAPVLGRHVAPSVSVPDQLADDLAETFEGFTLRDVNAVVAVPTQATLR